jgi:glutamate N-acetyltransferase / amino-acid N-acetyltransferase
VTALLTANYDIVKIEKGSIVTPKGFLAAGLHSGVKKQRNDLGAILCDVPASVASVYTLNKMQAAPLKVTKESIAKENKIQAIVVNSGNANACTGKQGLEDAYAMRKAAAEKFNISEHYAAVASTGVIGVQMPMDKVLSGIAKLAPEQTDESAKQFNEAIITTDLVTKSTCYQAQINGRTVTMAGSAKGSGMIKPNMATMLGFITTDAAVESGMLQLALKEVTDQTFNRITVDGDTSTNDMVTVMASGKAQNELLNPNHPEWQVFVQLLRQTSEDLAKMIARDGEGATKLIEVEVKGALNNEDAGKIAKAVVGSPLVKTAVYGTDANWGRIIAAVGYSEAVIDPESIHMFVGPIQMLKDSQPLPFSEEEATAYLENNEVKFTIDLQIGDGYGKAWGCDLTYDYVRINASYRS